MTFLMCFFNVVVMDAAKDSSSQQLWGGQGSQDLETELAQALSIHNKEVSYTVFSQFLKVWFFSPIYHC